MSRPKLAAYSQHAPAAAEQPAVSSEKMMQTSFRLTPSQWQALHEAAVARRVPVKTVMVDALRHYFDANGLKFD